jgi:hypothetical protein
MEQVAREEDEAMQQRAVRVAGMREDQIRRSEEKRAELEESRWEEGQMMRDTESLLRWPRERKKQEILLEKQRNIDRVRNVFCIQAAWGGRAEEVGKV